MTWKIVALHPKSHAVSMLSRIGLRPATAILCAAWWLVASGRPVSCGAEENQPPAEADQTAAGTITESAVRGHVRFLADDLLEGRAPGSRGDELAQRYIAAQFETLGLRPAGSDGSWLQKVPLLGVVAQAPPEISLRHDQRALALRQREDFVFTAGKPRPEVGFLDAEIVFVGYGIVAPEFDWDDYKGVDLRGKVLLMMNNDPSDDPQLFAGKRRLYYGRWDYKYESAARQGAAGAIIIHTESSAGYPYQVIQRSWTGEQFELSGATGPRLEIAGWFSEDATRRLTSLAGHDLDKLRQSAERRDFRPVPLGTRLSVSMNCKVREQDTANVLGILPGKDPELSQQLVVFMAHHDHLGVSAEPDARGDRICNGAVDNASGVAAMLAIAQACARLPEPPDRSILFAAVGAEEQGLLGSTHLAQNPPVPPGQLAAVINIDGLNILGPTRDVNVIGLGKSSLDKTVQRLATWQQRVVVPDQFPDRGYYYRSDQFSLARIGVPGVYLHSGTSVIGKPDGWGKERLEQWIKERYHQPSDEFSGDWNLSGAVLDVQLLFLAGLDVARQPAMPTWVPGDEFEATRKSAIEAIDTHQGNRVSP